MRAPPPTRRVPSGQVAVTGAVVDASVGALIVLLTTVVCSGPSAVEHIANAVALSTASN
jgi:hypothetical protein